MHSLFKLNITLRLIKKENHFIEILCKMQAVLYLITIKRFYVKYRLFLFNYNLQL